jgi:hypothetical protein
MAYYVFADLRLVEVCQTLAKAFAKGARAKGAEVHVFNEEKDEVIFIKRGVKNEK